METAIERVLRQRIMDWVAERAEANGGFLHREELLNYQLDGDPFPLLDAGRGIRNPRLFESTLSILSSASGPYDDAESDDGLLHYAYRKGDPWGGDNRKLRNALATGMPMILFRKEVKNIYTPVQPVYVVEDRPEEASFVIALDESFTYMPDLHHMTVPQRNYALRLAKQRLHQPAFRTRVLIAYDSRCAVCDLRHGSLLDAAHIVPDSHDLGTPTVNNGLSLCKIHHAAYDRNMLGVTPDREIRIAHDLLEEVDGPMLKYGLQEMHGRQLNVPRRPADHPDPQCLEWRYEKFVAR
jgi:putative restriction endonuclease